MKSFYDLSTCRINGMGMGQIPWRDIISYASWYNLEKDITEAFVDIIREMDTAYIDYQNKEQANNTN